MRDRDKESPLRLVVPASTAVRQGREWVQEISTDILPSPARTLLDGACTGPLDGLGRRRFACVTCLRWTRAARRIEARRRVWGALT